MSFIRAGASRAELIGGTWGASVEIDNYRRQQLGYFDTFVGALPNLTDAAIRLGQTFGNFGPSSIPAGYYPQQPLMTTMPVIPQNVIPPAGSSIWNPAPGGAATPISWFGPEGSISNFFQPQYAPLVDVQMDNTNVGGLVGQVNYQPGAAPGTFFAITQGGRPRTKNLISVPDWNGDTRYWVGGTKLSDKWIKSKILSDQRKRRCRPR